MRVYIVTEGGRDIGFGHISRCKAIYTAFTKKDIEPLFIVNADSSVTSLLKGTDYIILDWQKRKNELFDIIKYADIGILDSYLAPLPFYERFEKNVKVPIYIDDYMRLDYPRGVILNPSIFGDETDYKRGGTFPVLKGPDYVLLREEFWDVSPKKVRERVENILITFGGDDARSLTLKVLKLLDRDFPEFTKTVIVSKGFKDQDIKVLESEYRERPNITLIISPSGEMMRDAMLDADIAISAGGQTTYELARVGLPPIIIGIADNQRKNIEGWTKKGFIRYAGWWDDQGLLKKVKSEIEALKDFHVRSEIGEIGRSLIDGKGALRVVDELLSLVRL